MASALVSRVRQPSFFRRSFNFLRNLSTRTSDTFSSSPAAAGAGASPRKSKRKKKNNLFEVAQFLPNWGIGYHMAKTHWTNASYQITKINLYKEGRHGGKLGGLLIKMVRLLKRQK